MRRKLTMIRVTMFKQPTDGLGFTVEDWSTICALIKRERQRDGPNSTGVYARYLEGLLIKCEAFKRDALLATREQLERRERALRAELEEIHARLDGGKNDADDTVDDNG